jgi:hypothetical protein
MIEHFLFTSIDPNADPKALLAGQDLAGKFWAGVLALLTGLYGLTKLPRAEQPAQRK